MLDVPSVAMCDVSLPTFDFESSHVSQYQWFYHEKLPISIMDEIAISSVAYEDEL